MKPNTNFRLPASFLALILAWPAWALDYPLSPEAVREAYFFGRSSNRAKVSEFLGQYLRRFSPRGEGPNVGIIELHTPYEKVVRRSSENQATGYSAQQAQSDYSAQPDLIAVRMYLYLGGGLPDSYSDGKGRVLDRRENFWREFRFRVTQEHVIEPTRIVGQSLYGRRGQGLSGAMVCLEFDASQLASRNTTVEVIAPDGRTIKTDFDLDRLK